MEKTLFVKVGRAPLRPLCSSQNESVLDAVEQKTLQELLSGGNSPERIAFTRSNVEGAQETAKKGKK